jgi:hypothetical protein
MGDKSHNLDIRFKNRLLAGNEGSISAAFCPKTALGDGSKQRRLFNDRSDTETKW